MSAPEKAAKNDAANRKASPVPRDESPQDDRQWAAVGRAMAQKCLRISNDEQKCAIDATQMTGVMIN
jgi:hypothetical protein